MTLGFAVCGSAALINLGYNLLVVQPTAPWAVLPLALTAFGISLVFPILTLKVLDMYPRQRGAASSLQAVVGLSFNTTVAGLVSPLVSHVAWQMALVSACLTLAAWLTWRSYRRNVADEALVAGSAPARE